LVRLIDQPSICCGDHHCSVGPLRGAGPLAQCQGATP